MAGRVDNKMARRAVLTGLLLFVSAAAVTIAWAGVNSLSTPAERTRPEAVDTDAVDADAVDAERTDPAPAAPTNTDPASTATDAPATSPATTTPATTSPASTTSTTTTPATTTPATTTPATTSPDTTSPADATADDRTASAEPRPILLGVTGGTATILYAPESVRVLWAVTDPGYETTITDTERGTRIEFVGERHRAQIDAYWDNGPQHDITEQSR